MSRVAAIARYTAIILGLCVAATLLLAFGARFADGPIFVFPGGPFASGAVADYADVDWDSLAPVREIEFQLETPPRSRTSWFIVHENTPYIPCGFCTNRLLKRWPRELERDDRLILRIDGMRVLGRAVRVPNASSEFVAVRETKNLKYGQASGALAVAEDRAASAVVAAARLAPGAPSTDEPDSWLYRIDPR